MENAHPDRDTGSNPSSASGPDQTGSVPAFSTSAVSVSTDYETGLVAAEKKYKGRFIGITGTVDSTDKDSKDQPVVLPRGMDELSPVV